MRDGADMDGDADQAVNDLKKRSPETLRNLAGLRETSGNGLPILIPEGEDDLPLIQKAFRGRLQVRLVDGGKAKVLELAELLSKQGFRRTRILIDRDYETAARTLAVRDSNIIVTHAHDVLMDILLSDPKLASRVVEHVNKKRYREMDEVAKLEHVNNILEMVANSLLNLSAIRMFNVRYKFDLKFDNFPYAQYLSKTPARMDQAVRWVLIKSINRSAHPVDISALSIRGVDVVHESSAVLTESIGLGLRWELIGDHDFLATLNIFLDDRWGSNKLRTLFEAEIHESQIRLSSWGAAVERFIQSEE